MTLMNDDELEVVGDLTDRLKAAATVDGKIGVKATVLACCALASETLRALADEGFRQEAVAGAHLATKTFLHLEAELMRGAASEPPNREVSCKTCGDRWNWAPVKGRDRCAGCGVDPFAATKAES